MTHKAGPFVCYFISFVDNKLLQTKAVNQSCSGPPDQYFLIINSSSAFTKIIFGKLELQFFTSSFISLNFCYSYIAWQVHESNEGQHDFSGENDLFEFLHLAQKNSLLVILRPGPFIDAERDFGGLPSWLLRKKHVELRTSKDEFFMTSVKRWFSVLLPLLKPFIYRNGGPVIMIQVQPSYQGHRKYSASSGTIFRGTTTSKNGNSKVKGHFTLKLVKSSVQLPPYPQFLCP